MVSLLCDFIMYLSIILFYFLIVRITYKLLIFWIKKKFLYQEKYMCVQIHFRRGLNLQNSSLNTSLDAAVLMYFCSKRNLSIHVYESRAQNYIRANQTHTMVLIRRQTKCKRLRLHLQQQVNGNTFSKNKNKKFI